MDVVNSISQIIHHWAQNTPESCAIVPVPSRQPIRPNLSYEQLLNQSSQLITQLNYLGIKREDRVAIAVPNGPEMAVAILSIAAGATVVPLNPNYQEHEYEFYLSDLDAKALIIQQGFAKSAKIVALAKGIPVLELTPKLDAAVGSFQLNRAHSSKMFAPTWAKPEDTALILYTPGHTSRPKMVSLTHQRLCAAAQNIANTLALTADDRCLNIMPLFHIHGLVGGVLASLIVGASVVCTPGFNSELFLTWVKDCQSTWYSAVPTMHKSVLAQVQQQDSYVSSLRFIRSSSAALSARLMVDLETTFNVPVIEAYDMTEASQQITSNPLPPLLRKPGSVGVPGHTNVAIAAIDSSELLSQGKIGEVVIKGDTVTQGYANGPVADNNVFFDGWFRTGDQGYLDKDGYLFLQGRLREIVNRGGEKITPLEIDEVLMALPEVLQAVAFGFAHPTLGEELAVAVVLEPNATATPETLRDYLFAHMAAFKAPSQIILVDSLPKGATGQLQRMELAKKFANQLNIEFVTPTNDVEQSVANVMKEILHCDLISVADNFFVLGGDSLQANQVTTRLSARFKVNLSTTSLFRFPTVAKLANEITRLTTESDGLVQGILAQLDGLPPEEIERLLATG
ncbi:MAG: non-ribosomal peptide synthetase [Leptolyngbyaceae cyanobacterium MAG.088]|nr:non-ribosomal peptide synthetase [Leptolyngbyaceae cyanobacterium MAG.088]